LRDQVDANGVLRAVSSETLFILLRQVKLKELRNSVEDVLRFVAIHSLNKV